VNLDGLAELVLSVSDDGVVAFNRDRVCLHWSPAMDRLFEIDAATTVGRLLPAWVAFPLGEGEASPIDRVLAGEQVRIDECALGGRGGGGASTFEVRYVPWRSDGGDIEAGLAIFRDTSRRQRAEQRAKETEARFRVMADAAPVLLWMSGPDALCTFFNQTWLDFTGRTLEEEWGVGWAEGVHFEDFQRCIDIYMEAFADRRPFEMEYRLRRFDGQYRWVLDRGAPRWGGDGRFAGYIGSCVDITDRKDLELDLLRAVRVRDEFLSVASHELRTPLTALRLQLDSVARLVEKSGSEHLESGRLAASAGAARSQAGRLSTLVERLLDISRFSDGQVSLDHEELDLVSLVRGVVDVMRGQAQIAGCELRFAAPPTLRGCWDRMRLEQLVINLVGNATKFGAKRPIDIVLREGTGTLAGAAVLAVVDRGIGIDPLHKERIFGRFERAVARRHFGGLGLGLWVAKQIVEAHGGTISVDSSPGQGATFTVVLPMGESPAQQQKTA
jgi:PAS domain S-box-containing protein